MELVAVAPIGILLVTACVVLLGEFLLEQKGRSWLSIATLLGTVAALLASWALWGEPGSAFNGMLAVDGLSAFFHLVILLGLALTVLFSIEYLRLFPIADSEYYALLLLSTVGMLILVSAEDLLVLFLGLETMSIALYVLTGFTTRRVASVEAALKYLLIGAFATGFLLYGIAFIYGGAGTTKLAAVRSLLAGSPEARQDALFYAGLALLSIGLAFKVGAVPFHQWVPDVYEGAPTAVTAFMAASAKVAALAALLRAFPLGFAPLQPYWAGGLALLAALTMILGNLIALTQTNLKRLLAYSSIAHAGYILVGVVAGGALGLQAVLYYGLAYALMTLGSFGIIILLGERHREHLDLEEYRGLASTNPWLAWALAILLFSLAGFPPLGGFFAKYYVFLAAVQAGYTWLAVLGVLCSLISVYYYLRVVVLMFMYPASRVIRSAPSPVARAALWMTLVGVIWMGLLPSAFLDLAWMATGG